MKNLNLKSLVGLDVDVFLKEYWQKKPLLLRGALPGFTGFLSTEDVLLQCEAEQTPSRFISEKEGTVFGPFELDLKMLPDAGWTVLVQSLETVFEEAWQLLDLFSFLPRARLDDVMVSYARPKGGIGPHFDLYDVFLIQGEGCRRWRYAASPLADAAQEEASGHFAFKPDHDVEMLPGDVLYLPPKVPHEGSSILPSMTYSVGAASPRHQDLMGEFFAFISGEPELIGLDIEGMYRDHDAKAPSERGKVPDRLRNETLKLLQNIRFDESLVTSFLGRLLTAPRPHTSFEGLGENRDSEPDTNELESDFNDEENEAFEDNLTERLGEKGQLVLLPPTRMLHDGLNTVFMNGAAFCMQEPTIFLQLADERKVSLPISLSKEDALSVLFWLDEGYVALREG